MKRNEKISKFSIRKFSIGTTSVLIGVFICGLMFAPNAFAANSDEMNINENTEIVETIKVEGNELIGENKKEENKKEEVLEGVEKEKLSVLESDNVEEKSELLDDSEGSNENIGKLKDKDTNNPIAKEVIKEIGEKSFSDDELKKFISGYNIDDLAEEGIILTKPNDYDSLFEKCGKFIVTATVNYKDNSFENVEIPIIIQDTIPPKIELAVSKFVNNKNVSEYVELEEDASKVVLDAYRGEDFALRFRISDNSKYVSMECKEGKDVTSWLPDGIYFTDKPYGRKNRVIKRHDALIDKPAEVASGNTIKVDNKLVDRIIELRVADKGKDTYIRRFTIKIHNQSEYPENRIKGTTDARFPLNRITKDIGTGKARLITDEELNKELKSRIYLRRDEYYTKKDRAEGELSTFDFSKVANYMNAKEIKVKYFYRDGSYNETIVKVIVRDEIDPDIELVKDKIVVYRGEKVDEYVATAADVDNVSEDFSGISNVILYAAGGYNKISNIEAERKVGENIKARNELLNKDILRDKIFIVGIVDKNIKLGENDNFKEYRGRLVARDYNVRSSATWINIEFHAQKDKYNPQLSKDEIFVPSTLRDEDKDKILENVSVDNLSEEAKADGGIKKTLIEDGKIFSGSGDNQGKKVAKVRVEYPDKSIDIIEVPVVVDNSVPIVLVPKNTIILTQNEEIKNEIKITVKDSDGSGIEKIEVTNLPDFLVYDKEKGKIIAKEDIVPKNIIAENVNKKSYEIKVKATDKVGNYTEKTMNITVQNQANKYNPSGKDQNIDFGSVPKAEDSIEHKDSLPKGTAYSWKEKPVVNGVAKATVIVTYPDNSTDILDATLRSNIVPGGKGEAPDEGYVRVTFTTPDEKGKLEGATTYDVLASSEKTFSNLEKPIVSAKIGYRFTGRWAVSNEEAKDSDKITTTRNYEAVFEKYPDVIEVTDDVQKPEGYVTVIVSAGVNGTLPERMKEKYYVTPQAKVVKVLGNNQPIPNTGYKFKEWDKEVGEILEKDTTITAIYSVVLKAEVKNPKNKAIEGKYYRSEGVVLSKNKEEAKVIPTQINGLTINAEGYVEGTPSELEWTEDEEEKIVSILVRVEDEGNTPIEKVVEVKVQRDTDKDGTPDVEDLDDDNDGIEDEKDTTKKQRTVLKAEVKEAVTLLNPSITEIADGTTTRITEVLVSEERDINNILNSIEISGASEDIIKRVKKELVSNKIIDIPGEGLNENTTVVRVKVTYLDSSGEECSVKVYFNKKTEAIVDDKDSISNQPSKITLVQRQGGDVVVTPFDENGNKYSVGSKVYININENNVIVEIDENGEGILKNNDLPKEESKIMVGVEYIGKEGGRTIITAPINLVVPGKVFSKKGEANVELALEEYPLDKVPTYSEKGEVNVESELPEGKVPKEQKGDFETGKASVEPELPEGEVPKEQKGDFETGEANVEPALEEYPLDKVPAYSEKGEANVELALEEYPLDKVPTYSEKGEVNAELELPEGKVPTEQKGDFETEEANAEPELTEGKIPTEQKGDFEAGEENVEKELLEMSFDKILQYHENKGGLIEATAPVENVTTSSISKISKTTLQKDIINSKIAKLKVEKEKLPKTSVANFESAMLGLGLLGLLGTRRKRENTEK